MRFRFTTLLIVVLCLSFQGLPAQTFMLGTGIDVTFKEEYGSEYMTFYTFPEKTQRVLLLPTIELNHFGIVMPLYYSSQPFSYITGPNYHYSSPYSPYPNKYATVESYDYKGNYTCTAFGLQPYLVFGKKVKFVFGVGLFAENYIMTHKSIHTTIHNFHFDSSAVYVNDGYIHYDSLQPNAPMGTDWVSQIHAGFQFELTSYIRLSTEVQFRKTQELNSINVSGKQSFALSFALFYVWPDRKKKYKQEKHE